MIVETNFEILSQYTGEFVGGCEILEGSHFAVLWDADGDFSVNIHIEGMQGDALYRLIINEFASCKDCYKSSIYLTDEGQNEILMAL